MASAELEDRISIRDRYSAYSDAVFQQDNEAWLACWSEGGVWAIFGKEITGKEALRKQWAETWKTIDRMAFFCEVGAIEIDGSKASVRSYCHEIVSFKEGKLLKVIAQYSDELVKEGGAWVFSRRVYSVLMRE